MDSSISSEANLPDVSRIYPSIYFEPTPAYSGELWMGETLIQPARSLKEKKKSAPVQKEQTKAEWLERFRLSYEGISADKQALDEFFVLKSKEEVIHSYRVLNFLTQTRIGTIVSFQDLKSDGISKAQMKKFNKALNTLGIEVLHFSMADDKETNQILLGELGDDGKTLMRKLDDCVINAAVSRVSKGKTVYFQCLNGTERSGRGVSACMTKMMKKHHLDVPIANFMSSLRVARNRAFAGKTIPQFLENYQEYLNSGPLGSHTSTGSSLKEEVKSASTSRKRKPTSASDKMTAEFILLEANSMYHAGRFEEAIKIYDRALEVHPDYAFALYNKANALSVLQLYREALPCYDRAFGIDPTYADAYDGKGAALYALNRFDEALPYHDKAVQISPTYAVAHNNRAKVLMKQDKYDEALEAVSKAIALNSGDEEFHETKGLIQKVLSGKSKKQTQEEDKQSYADNANRKGNVYLRMQEYEKAIEQYNETIRYDPSDPFAYQNKASALYNLGRFREAIESTEKALLVNPGYANAYYTKGMNHAALGEKTDALNSFNRAIEFNSGDPDFFLMKGNLYLEWRNGDEALKCFNLSTKIDPGYVPGYSGKGDALLLVGELEAALKAYDKAISLNPHYPSALSGRAAAMKAKKPQLSKHKYDENLIVSQLNKLILQG